MKEWPTRFCIIIGGLSFMAFVLHSSASSFFHGDNVFVPFYVSAKIVGTSDLYETDPYFDFMSQRFGSVSNSLRFIRLPFYALILWPLGLLSYENAYLVWTLYRVLAFAGFLVLWRIPSRADTLTFAALSLPAFSALWNGQDSLVFLLMIALAVHLEKQRKAFAGGLALSFCAIKPHLLVLLPILLIGQRRWRMTCGLVIGGLVLLVLCFIAAGPNWPIKFFRAISDSNVHPVPEVMPNLNGLFQEWLFRPYWIGIVSAAIIATCSLAIRRVPFQLGLALVLLGSLLVGYHAYMTDCVILLPVGLSVMATTRWEWMRLFTALILSPLAPLAVTVERPYPYVLQIALLLFFFATAFEWIGRFSKRTRHSVSAGAGGP